MKNQSLAEMVKMVTVGFISDQTANTAIGLIKNHSEGSFSEEDGIWLPPVPAFHKTYIHFHLLFWPFEKSYAKMELLNIHIEAKKGTVPTVHADIAIITRFFYLRR